MENALLTIILVLIGLLFVREVMVQYFKKIFGVGKTDEEKRQNEEKPIWASALEQHFNHETTENQEQIISELRQIKQLTESTCSKTSRALDHIEQMRMDGVRVKNGKK